MEIVHDEAGRRERFVAPSSARRQRGRRRRERNPFSLFVLNPNAGWLRNEGGTKRLGHRWTPRRSQPAARHANAPFPPAYFLPSAWPLRPAAEKLRGTKTRISASPTLRGHGFFSSLSSYFLFFEREPTKGPKLAHGTHRTCCTPRLSFLGTRWLIVNAGWAGF